MIDPLAELEEYDPVWISSDQNNVIEFIMKNEVMNNYIVDSYQDQDFDYDDGGALMDDKFEDVKKFATKTQEGL